MQKNNDINIYFYGPAPMKYSYEVSGGEGKERNDQYLFFNTVPVYLDSYIKNLDSDFHSRLNWQHIQLLFKTQEEIIAEIEKYNIDVVCASVYIWNHEQTLDMLSGIKKRLNKDITIIVGGPSVGVVRDQTYLTRNPDIDYAIYAQGEKPFYDILKHKFDDKPISVLTTKNCAWEDSNGKLKKSDYEFYRLTKGSPYLESKHIIENAKYCDEYKDYIFELPWETSKGCPYNCSFCDWTSGLGNKVSKRKAIYEEELEFFASLGIFKFYMSDANFGLHKEDIEITKTLARMRKEKGYPFEFFSINFSKVKKDVVYELADIFLEYDLLPLFKCSVQDIHAHILDNIDRPDMPWDEQLEHIKTLIKKHPHKPISVEVIQGLPGQTRETWEHMLCEMARNGFGMHIYKFMIIPNSPAGYDQEWCEKMEIKTEQLYLDEDHSDEYVTGSYSYNLEDYAYFNLSSEFFLRLQTAKFNDKNHLEKLLRFANRMPEFKKVMELMLKYVTYTPKSVLIANLFVTFAATKYVEELTDQHDINEFYAVLYRPDLVNSYSRRQIYQEFESVDFFGEFFEDY